MSYRMMYPVQSGPRPTAFFSVPEAPPSEDSVPVQMLEFPHWTESNVQQHLMACPPRKKLKPVHSARGNKEGVQHVMNWAKSTTHTPPPNAISTAQRQWEYSDCEDHMSTVSFADDEYEHLSQAEEDSLLDKAAPQHSMEQIGGMKAPPPSSPPAAVLESRKPQSGPLEDSLSNSGSRIYWGLPQEVSKSPAKDRGLLFGDDSIVFYKPVDPATGSISGSDTETDTDSDEPEGSESESSSWQSCSTCLRRRRASLSSSECDFSGCSGDSSDSDSQLSLTAPRNVTIAENDSVSPNSDNDSSERASDSSENESDFSDQSSTASHDDSLSIDKREFRGIVRDILVKMEKSQICWGPGALDTLQALAEEFAVNELKGVFSLSTCWSQS
jgi:hypothetical protein